MLTPSCAQCLIALQRSTCGRYGRQSHGRSRSTALAASSTWWAPGFHCIHDIRAPTSFRQLPMLSSIERIEMPSCRVIRRPASAPPRVSDHLGDSPATHQLVQAAIETGGGIDEGPHHPQNVGPLHHPEGPRPAQAARSQRPCAPGGEQLVLSAFSVSSWTCSRCSPAASPDLGKICAWTCICAFVLDQAVIVLRRDTNLPADILLSSSPFTMQSEFRRLPVVHT